MKKWLACLLFGCALGVGAEGMKGHAMTPGPKAALAVLSSASGSSVSGWVRFTDKGKGQVRVSGVLRGLTPGKHGFHIHEFGDCSAPDAVTAGGHFNPSGHGHGAPEHPERHMGDLGNLSANRDGIAKFDRPIMGLELSAILGRSVVVHRDADDLRSQPAGNSGPRVGCGVIGVSNTVAKNK